MSRFEESHDLVPDLDPGETQEWTDSLDAVLDQRGPSRARFLVRKLLKHSEARDIGLKNGLIVNQILFARGTHEKSFQNRNSFATIANTM